MNSKDFLLLILTSLGWVPSTLASLTAALKTEECKTNKLDLVIVLDSSGSVGKTNFDRTRNFTYDIISNLPVAPDAVRVAVVRYSTRAKIITHLNKHMDKQEKLQDVKGMAFRSGTTYTDRALELIKNSVLTPQNGDRADVKDFIILTTDGESNRRDRTEKFAIDLKKREDLKIMVIGIGAKVNKTELHAIASDSSYVYRVAFSRLWQVVKNISQVTCPEPLTSPVVANSSTQSTRTASITSEVTQPSTTARDSSTSTISSTVATSSKTTTTTTPPTNKTTTTTTTIPDTTTTTPPPNTTTTKPDTTTTTPPLNATTTTTEPDTTTTTPPPNTTTTTTTTTTEPDTTTTTPPPNTKTKPDTTTTTPPPNTTTTTTTTATAKSHTTTTTSPPNTTATTTTTTTTATTTITTTKSDTTIARATPSPSPSSRKTSTNTFTSGSSRSSSPSQTHPDVSNVSTSSLRSFQPSLSEETASADETPSIKNKASARHRGQNQDHEDFKTVAMAGGLGALGLVMLGSVTACLVYLLGRRKNDDDEENADEGNGAA